MQYPNAGPSTPERYRVAMVAACPFPANHGTPGAIRELSVTLARLGHEVHVVTYPMGDALPVEGLTLHRVSSPLREQPSIKVGPSRDRLLFDFVLVPKLVDVIRRHRIDVIHAHNYEATIAGALAKWATGTPLVYNGINSMADELPSYDFLRPRLLAAGFGKVLDHLVPRTADALIVLSDELRRYLESLGVRNEKMIVIPPGVTVSDFENGDGARVRRRHALDVRTPLVMYTGALETFQRVDYLVRAMAIVAEEFPTAVLVLANNVPNADIRRSLMTLAEDVGVADKIVLAESVSLPELPDYLAAADVAVVPRPSCPGFPIKLLNYMAAGKAVVSFEGSAKCLCHGYNGYIARNEDVDDLARGILLFLRDPALRAEVGGRARDSLRGVYDWETVAEATALIYGQVVRGQRRLDRRALAAHVKASYVPRFANGGQDNPTGFLQKGPIEYPTF